MTTHAIERLPVQPITDKKLPLIGDDRRELRTEFFMNLADARDFAFVSREFITHVLDCGEDASDPEGAVSVDGDNAARIRYCICNMEKQMVALQELWDRVSAP